MSATFRWQFVSNSRRILPVPAPSAFIDAMERIFGAAPWHLEGRHQQTLEGMAAVHGGKRENNPYLFIVDKLIEGPIEVEVTY